MFIPRIYYPHPLQVGQNVALDKGQAHYLTTVLRLKNNEKLILFNGEANEYTGICSLAHKKIQITIISFLPVDRSSSLKIHLGQGLARTDRMDFVIQKATELGVAEITPLMSMNAQVKLDHVRSQKRLVHWEHIAISASEQCGRTDIPIIHAPIALNDWVQQSFDGTSLIFDTKASTPLKNIQPQMCIRLAIGPESGWHEQETVNMLKHQFVSCSLGPRILRTETAPIAALSIIQGLFGDLG